MTVGDCCFHCCAVPTSFNLQTAAELPDSFSHACDTYANRLCPRRMVQHSIRYPLTLVTDQYDDSIGEILLNRYLGLAGSRMEVNVCKTGLHDAEDRKLGFFRQARQFLRYSHFDMQAVALVNSTHIAFDCRVQTTFIKHGRMQQVGKSSEFIGNALRERFALQDDLLGFLRGCGNETVYPRQ